MDPLIFVVAIMGCADGGQVCETVATQPVRYETRSACLAAAQQSVANYDTLPYPHIEARCERRGLQTAALRGNRR